MTRTTQQQQDAPAPIDMAARIKEARARAGTQLEQLYRRVRSKTTDRAPGALARALAEPRPISEGR